MSSSGPHILDVAPALPFGEEGFIQYITNTVLSTWIFIGIVIILGIILKLASKKDSGFVRSTGFLIVKHLKSFFKPLLGHHLAFSKTLWFVGGIFLYILGANLYSLLLDWFLAFAPGFHSYLRPINSDINTTLGMAVLVILVSHIIMIRFRWVFKYVLHYIFHFEGNSVVEKIINVVVGWIHLIWEWVRVMSLSLRLFGNIFAGAVLLGVMGWLTAKIGVATIPLGNILLIPFYFFEMFVGFIQAMVFAMLASLYFEEASSSH